MAAAAHDTVQGSARHVARQRTTRCNAAHDTSLQQHKTASDRVMDPHSARCLLHGARQVPVLSQVVATYGERSNAHLLAQYDSAEARARACDAVRRAPRRAPNPRALFTHARTARALSCVTSRACARAFVRVRADAGVCVRACVCVCVCVSE